MRKSIRKIIAIASASVMALTFAVTSAPNASAGAISKAAKEAAKAAFDPSGKTTYHAYFGLQQKESWIFRDEWYQEENGLNGKNLPNGAYEGKMYQSKDNANSEVPGATVTDAEIKGNGVYTVGVKDLGGVLTSAESSQQAVMSMLYVSTDIPMSAYTDGKIKVTDWKLKIDNTSATLQSDIFVPTEYTDESGLFRFDPFNLYQKENGPYPNCPSIRTPNDSVEITFKVSGFDVDNPDAVEATPTPAADASSSSSSSSSSSISGGAVAAIVVVAVVVIAGIVVVVKRKKD